ncbi:ABC transporter ATP-binding protein [Mesorhizobium sanjuanii]|uniref:ABC transporter ATP-binding protein n=1 Tax=Mesorhizobium sanjuanii TaxID=2037900 RepID=A0A2A6FM17_9HYPH|nr:ABC transporter ATP-binding protein [Mesorhizobium sanjuanii]PDQ22691.1 ABC transporter ATP-binding protein [Mesorhizobium sanjuanii]
MATELAMEVTGLRAGYGATPILQGVDMRISPGEIVALIGRNGVGKTTTVRTLTGLLRADAGAIRLHGRDITSATADARARLGIGYIPQGREVFPRMTVDENLTVGELIGGTGGTKLRDFVFEVFPRLSERRRQIAGTMSGGEQQQLAIGRALIGRPTFMLLDEPSEGVQPSIVQMICAALQRIRVEIGTTILFVEQNMDTILSIAERCYVMEKGRIVSEIHGLEMNAESIRRHLLI